MPRLALGNAMRRRSSAGATPLKVSRRKAVRPKRRNASKISRRRRSSSPDLIDKIALFRRERDQSLEQQKATAEILRVISASPGDLKPIFAVILGNATRLCQANFGVLFLCEGDAYRAVAMHNAPSAYVEARRREPLVSMTGTTVIAEVARTKRTVQTADMAKNPAYRKNPQYTQLFVRLTGARSFVGVPMLKDDSLIGVIGIFRQEVQQFTDKQVELVESFAAQAVIAIENTRLLSELRQSLEQQTATAEVLGVISASPGDLQPVFQAMLESATRICEARLGNLLLFDGKDMRVVAMHNAPREHMEMRRRNPVIPLQLSICGPVIRTKKLMVVADITAEEPYASSPLAKAGGARTALAVPMLRENELIGVITIYRQDVRPFTAKQIELVTNFAAQAVIAIENTRLLSELRQSLEQQTATAEVLSVISSSPGDLEPVFNAMLANAVRICQAKFGTLFVAEGDKYRTAAGHNMPSEFLEERQRTLISMTGDTALARVARTKQPVQIPDVAEDPAYRSDPQRLSFVSKTGARTVICVPMLKDGTLVGAVAIYRQEVRPFADKQIDLLTNFAAQAVIAIENTRLLSELRQRTADLTESLENLRAAQDRLVQTEKLASLGQLTAGIAHEIKNPLNFVNNFSSVSVELIDELRQALEGVHVDSNQRAEIGQIADTLRDNLDKIVQHGKRADAIVKNMLLHSRQGSGDHRPVDINALVEESLHLAYHGARAETQGFNITLERSFDPAAGEVDLLPQEITRVLLNLISNGFYAATKRGAEENGDHFEPTLTVATSDLGHSVEIRIRDNGTGIPPEVKEKMFNPFFTTKPAGEGTGLGLSISHDIIVKQHSGSIEVETEPGAFTEFRIILPRKGVWLLKLGERA